MKLIANGTLGRFEEKMLPDSSYIETGRGLHLEYGNEGEGIDTSYIVAAYQTGENEITFRTYSGSTYVVQFESEEEYASIFATSVFSSVYDGVEAYKPICYSVMWSRMNFIPQDVF